MGSKSTSRRVRFRKAQSPATCSTFIIDVDHEATAALKKDTQALQDKLRKTDSGKDISL